MPTPTQILICLCFLTGFLILAHQYVFYGVWFEITDIHHETFAIVFFSFGLGILLGVTRKTGKP